MRVRAGLGAMLMVVLAGGCAAASSTVEVAGDTGGDSGRPGPADVAGDADDAGGDGGGDGGAADVADDAGGDAGDGSGAADSGADSAGDDADGGAGDAVTDGSGGADVGADVDEPDTFGGPPTITNVFPLVAVSEGVIYVEGEFLARPPNDIRGVEAEVLPDGSPPRIPLGVVSGIPTRLVLSTPADYADRLFDRGTLRLTTPDGAVDWEWVYATNDTTFTGKTLVGTGLLGNVYAMQPETRRLPDLDDACAQPEVLTPPAAPCPYTSLLAPQVDVPDREFDLGFPALGETLVEWFAIRFAGYLDIPTAGTWGFRVCSDDGSKLWLFPGGTRTLVIDNDGTHSVECVSGSVDLPVGLTEVRLDYFQGPRNRIALQFYWTPPGGAEAIVPEDALDLFASPFIPR